MKKILLLCFMLLSPIAAHAQAQFVTPNGGGNNAAQGNVDMCINSSGYAVPNSAASPCVIGTSSAAQGAVPMTIGTAYAAQRSFAALCTAAGNVSVTFPDGSTLVVPVVTGYQSFPFGVTKVNSSGTTATCTYDNLK